MPKKVKLKVFRTSAGFHDAYVAAPSQKAALAAWGADTDLFSVGMAEPVTDAELTKEPLAKPGVVIKRLRATADEHLAEAAKGRGADGKSGGQRQRADPSNARSSAQAKAPPKPKSLPKPKRTALDRAEERLSQAEQRQQKAQEEVTARIDALVRERTRLRERHNDERRKLEDAVARAQDDYEGALARWRS